MKEQLRKHKRELARKLVEFMNNIQRGEISLSAEAIEKLLKQIGYLKNEHEKDMGISQESGSNIDPELLKEQQKSNIYDRNNEMHLDNSKQLLSKLNNLENNYNNSVNNINIDTNDPNKNINDIMEDYLNNLVNSHDAAI